MLAAAAMLCLTGCHSWQCEYKVLTDQGEQQPASNISEASTTS